MAAVEKPTDDLQTLFDRMRHICEQLEHRDIKLEDAVELHAQGVAIEKRIRAILEDADRRVLEVIGEDGKIEPLRSQTKTR